MENSTKPWYKYPLGQFFLVILGILAIFVLIFGSLFGYYFYKITIKKETSKLDKIFSVKENKGIRISSIDKDIQNYIRSFNPTIGNPEAPITILAFMNFECPYSRGAHNAFWQMLQKYEPTIKVVFKQVPIETVYPNSKAAALASKCAHEQGKFWDYAKVLFENSLEKDNLNLLAGNIKLNKDTFNECLTNNNSEKGLVEDLQDAAELGVIGTPTFFVNKTKLEGTIDLDTWDKIILENLQQK